MALCLISVPALADATWKWKTTAGTCSDGNDVTITEAPGLLKYNSQGKSGPQYQEIPLATDGSGKKRMEIADGYLGSASGRWRW